MVKNVKENIRAIFVYIPANFQIESNSRKTFEYSKCRIRIFVPSLKELNLPTCLSIDLFLGLVMWHLLNNSTARVNCIVNCPFIVLVRKTCALHHTMITPTAQPTGASLNQRTHRSANGRIAQPTGASLSQRAHHSANGRITQPTDASLSQRTHRSANGRIAQQMNKLSMFSHQCCAAIIRDEVITIQI